MSCHLFPKETERSREEACRILREYRGFPGRVITKDSSSPPPTFLISTPPLEEVLFMWAAGVEFASFLGAGVTSKERGSNGVVHFCGAEFRIGRFLGDQLDAELFAVAAALGRAMRLVEEGANVKLVKVYTNAAGLLEVLASHTCETSGPWKQEMLALEHAYKAAAWLAGRGFEVDVCFGEAHTVRGMRTAHRLAVSSIEVQRARWPETDYVAFGVRYDDVDQVALPPMNALEGMFFIV